MNHDDNGVRELVLRYARAADCGTSDEFADLFVPGAVLEVRGLSPEPRFNVEERLHRTPALLRERYVRTLHVVANHTWALDGDTGTGAAYCVAHHLHQANGEAAELTDLTMFIIYHDRYARHTDGWRFAARLVDVQWTTESPGYPRLPPAAPGEPDRIA